MRHARRCPSRRSRAAGRSWSGRDRPRPGRPACAGSARRACSASPGPSPGRACRPRCPVPDVVGTWTSATCRPLTFSAPTTSWIACPLPGSTATSLARSIALPPPKPTTRSGSHRSAAASAASRVGMSGSKLTSPKTVTSPGRSSSSTRAALNGSATTSGRRSPLAAAKRATAATVPEPNSMASGRTISIGSSQAVDVIAGRAISGGHHACTGRASVPARSSAARMLPWSARPVPAMSNAVPWSTLVRKNGQPDRDVDARVEAHELDRDVALVVVLHDDDVEAALPGVHEHRVRRPRARGVDPLRARGLDGRGDDVAVLRPEQAGLAGVRVQPGHGHARARRSRAGAASGRRAG